MSRKNDHGLTMQQEAFAQAVGGGSRLVDAYKQAYTNAKAKASTMHENACRLAAHPQVAARINAIQAKSAELAELDGAEILREIKKIALSDISGVTHPDGRVKLPHELDAATRAAVESADIVEVNGEIKRIRYKFWDKARALDMAMKHLGLYAKDNAQKPEGGTTNNTVVMVQLVPLVNPVSVVEVKA
jgi:hypothetical protein